MNTTVTVLLFFIYIAAMIAIGVYQSRRVKSMESYWMADRNLSWWRIGFCMAASWYGLSSFTGQAGWIYDEGLGSMFYLAVPNVAAIVLVGFVFTKRIRRIPAISQPEFLEIRYSGAVRPWLAMIILIAFAGYSAMEFIALEYVFVQFLGWPGWVGAIVVVIATMIYVNFGGMNTVVITEVIQYILLFTVCAIVGIGSVIKGSAIIKAGGTLWPADTSIFSIPHLDSDVSWYSLLSLGLGMSLILIAAYWPAWSSEQDPWQRIWQAKDTKHATFGALSGAIIQAVCYTFTILVAVGAWVIVGPPSEQAADFNREVIVFMMIQNVIPSWFFPILVVGFLAAAMSNISTFATSSASNLAKDIYQRYLRPHASQREMLWASRGTIVVTLSLGVLAGVAMPSILDAVFTAASLATCGYFIPIVGALWWRRGTTAGALAAFIFGSISYLILALGQMFGGWEIFIEPVIIGICVSLISYIVGSLATAPPSTRQLLTFFEQDAESYIDDWKAAGVSDTASSESKNYVQEHLTEWVQGERVLITCEYKIEGASFPTAEIWEKYINALFQNKSWAYLAGYDVVYKIVMKDMLGNVRLARGDAENNIILYCEPLHTNIEAAKQAIAVAIDDINTIDFAGITKA